MKEVDSWVDSTYIIPTIYTFMLSERAAAFVTRGKMPYSANSPTKDDVKIYLSSSATCDISIVLQHVAQIEYENKYELNL